MVPCSFTTEAQRSQLHRLSTSSCEEHRLSLEGGSECYSETTGSLPQFSCDFFFKIHLVCKMLNLFAGKVNTAKTNKFLPWEAGGCKANWSSD